MISGGGQRSNLCPIAYTHIQLTTCKFSSPFQSLMICKYKSSIWYRIPMIHQNKATRLILIRYIPEVEILHAFFLLFSMFFLQFLYQCLSCRKLFSFRRRARLVFAFDFEMSSLALPLPLPFIKAFPLLDNHHHIIRVLFNALYSCLKHLMQLSQGFLHAIYVKV